MLKQLKILLLIVSVSLATSCYHIPIQQGNILPDEAVQSIRNGMTLQQVKQILGAPVLINPYVGNQLAYVYTFKPNIGRFQMTRMIIYFSNGRVVNSTVYKDSPKK